MDRKERKARIAAKLQNTEPPQALLLEMDGVLIDNKSILYNVYMDLLLKQGRTGSKQEFNELFGLPIPIFLMTLIEKYGLKTSLEGLEITYKEFLAKHYTQTMPVFPLALKCLEHAREMGIALALIAFSDPTLSTLYLEKNQLKPFFDAIITSKNVTVNENDSPNLYQQALTVLGTTAEDAVSIVQSFPSAAASLEAHIETLWLTQSRSNSNTLMNRAQCHRMRDWSEALNCLRNWYAEKL